MGDADQVYERRKAHLERLSKPFDTESDKLAEWCAFVENEVVMPPVVAFTPTRFPWTYAADYLRTRPWMVPDEIVSKASVLPGNDPSKVDREFCRDWHTARSSAVVLLKTWSRELGLSDRDMATALAVAHCRENRIEIPAETLHQVDQGQPIG